MSTYTSGAVVYTIRPRAFDIALVDDTAHNSEHCSRGHRVILSMMARDRARARIAMYGVSYINLYRRIVRWMKSIQLPHDCKRQLRAFSNKCFCFYCIFISSYSSAWRNEEMMQEQIVKPNVRRRHINSQEIHPTQLRT